MLKHSGPAPVLTGSYRADEAALVSRAERVAAAAEALARHAGRVAEAARQGRTSEAWKLDAESAEFIGHITSVYAEDLGDLLV